MFSTSNPGATNKGKYDDFLPLGEITKHTRKRKLITEIERLRNENAELTAALNGRNKALIKNGIEIKKLKTKAYREKKLRKAVHEIERLKKEYKTKETDLLTQIETLKNNKPNEILALSTKLIEVQSQNDVLTTELTAVRLEKLALEKKLTTSPKTMPITQVFTGLASNSLFKFTPNSPPATHTQFSAFKVRNPASC